MGGNYQIHSHQRLKSSEEGVFRAREASIKAVKLKTTEIVTQPTHEGPKVPWGLVAQVHAQRLKHYIPVTKKWSCVGRRSHSSPFLQIPVSS